MKTKTITSKGGNGMPEHAIVSQDEWLAARKELLKEEKEFTRLRDRLTAKCRELPWVKVETVYVFDGPNGKETLPTSLTGAAN